MDHQKLIAVAFLLLVGTAWSNDPPAKPEITEQIISISKESNGFATDLYSHLRSDKPVNLFFSPYSISTALAMTYVGANGPTKSQMAEVLHLPKNDSELNSTIKSLNALLVSTDDETGFQLRVANRLWGQIGFQFVPEFLQVTKDDYGADLGLVDFKETEIARRAINSWVNGQTDRKIRNLIAPGVLGSDTRLVLTNAIYFKARWTEEFKKNVTADAPFHVSASQQITVPTMQQMHHFRYVESNETQILELPYGQDNSLSMLILLPKKIEGLADLEKQLSAQNLEKWTDGLESTQIKVQLPKFKMTSEFSLKDVLTSMGMSLAFSPSADFSKISTEQRLFISAVIHKAFVDVNEEGTEAAAATAVAMRMTAIAPGQKPPIEFRADHPFVFLIRHNQTQSILFFGRVVNPKE